MCRVGNIDLSVAVGVRQRERLTGKRFRFGVFKIIEKNLVISCFFPVNQKAEEKRVCRSSSARIGLGIQKTRCSGQRFSFSFVIDTTISATSDKLPLRLR